MKHRNSPTKVVVKYVDLIRIHNADDSLIKQIECKLCGGLSAVGLDCQGIVHNGDCVVDRWEVQRTIEGARRGSLMRFAGGYRHSVDVRGIYKRNLARRYTHGT